MEAAERGSADEQARQAVVRVRVQAGGRAPVCRRRGDRGRAGARARAVLAQTRGELGAGVSARGRGRVAAQAERPSARCRGLAGSRRAGAVAGGEPAAVGGERLPKKIAGLEGAGARVKTQAVAALKADYPLPVLLAVAGLARSTFFYHQARPDRPDPHAGLKAAIAEAFEAARGRYGHRRVHAVLVRAGWRVAKKTVRTLMNALGLVCQVRRPRRRRTWPGQPGTAAENLLNREFGADAPDTKWVTDVTEFRIGDRKLYLSPVIDLFDRSVVAYACGPSPTLELTNSSLRAAIATLPAGARPLVHSDQGFQYQHASWRTLLADAGLTQSMSRRATCLDNAVAENFFGHLKEELFHHTKFDTVDTFITALHDYIDWYNTTRISTTLQGLSPAEYRAQTPAA
ncbi:IS3 family transposase [Amycolatopsis sp. A1MSW2902]